MPTPSARSQPRLRQRAARPARRSRIATAMRIARSAGFGISTGSLKTVTRTYEVPREPLSTQISALRYRPTLSRYRSRSPRSSRMTRCTSLRRRRSAGTSRCWSRVDRPRTPRAAAGPARATGGQRRGGARLAHRADRGSLPHRAPRADTAGRTAGSRGSRPRSARAIRPGSSRREHARRSGTLAGDEVAPKDRGRTGSARPAKADLVPATSPRLYHATPRPPETIRAAGPELFRGVPRARAAGVRRSAHDPVPIEPSPDLSTGADAGSIARRRTSSQARHQLHRLGLFGRDRQPGDAALGPGAVALADARDRAHQRHLVAEFVRDGGDGLVLPPGEIQLLNALRRIAEAAADHHFLVKILVAMPHAADVERHARLHARERAAHIVGDRDLGARLDLEVGEALAGARAAKAFLEPGPQHRHEPRHEAERQPPVGDLRRQLHVRLGAGAEPDRQPRIHVQDRHERLADAERAGTYIRKRDLAPGVGHGLLALEHLAHDGDVVADAPVRLAPGLAVPAFHDLWAGDAEPGDDAAAPRERVERARRHGGRGRRARGELHDAGAEADPFREGRQVGERRDRVRAVRLGRPHRVVPEALREQHLVDRQAQLCTRVADAQTELHDALLLTMAVTPRSS